MDEELEQGDKVKVGLFPGTVVRVNHWHGDISVDVEIGGVVDRYKREEVTLVKKKEA